MITFFNKRLIIACIVFLMFLTLLSGCSTTENFKKSNRLFEAIRFGEYETVCEILTASPELINEYDQIKIGMNYAETQTPLTLACQHSNFEIVKFLISNGADVNKPSKNLSVNPLTIALYNNDYEIAYFLLDNGADVLSEDFYNFVPFAIVKNYIDSDDITLQQKRLDLIKRFITPNYSSLDISEKYSAQFIFRCSVESNSILVVKYFLDNQIVETDVRLEYKNQTALIVAVKENMYGMCKLLLEHDADVTIKDDLGKTAYDYAVELGNQHLLELLS